MSKYSSETPLEFDSVAMGDVLPPLTKEPTPVGVTLFCAAIRNFHRLHFDDGFAREQKLDGALVPGFLIGNWCAEAACRAFPPDLRVARLRFRNKKTAYIRGTYSIEGQVSAIVDDSGPARRVTCQITVYDQDRAAVADATVDLVRKDLPEIGVDAADGPNHSG